jgi:hypothetical protein
MNFVLVMLQPKNDKFRIIAVNFDERRHSPEIIQDQAYVFVKT